MDKESVTGQSALSNVTARVKFSNIPIAPLQGANVSGRMATGGGPQKNALCPRLPYVTASRSILRYLCVLCVSAVNVCE